MHHSHKPSSMVVFLLDRTGSMASCKDATIEGFNGYLGRLQAEQGAEILFSLVQFDHHAGQLQLEKFCVMAPVAEVDALTDQTFQPRGGTPLIDAAYSTIKAVVAVAAIRTDKPRIVVCIQTDGHENCSVEHGWVELRGLIQRKQKEGWEFNFLGAGIDAYVQGARMGVAMENTMSYGDDCSENLMAAFTASARTTADFATLRANTTAFSKEDRARAGDAFIDRAGSRQGPILDLNDPATPHIGQPPSSPIPHSQHGNDGKRPALDLSKPGAALGVGWGSSSAKPALLDLTRP